MIVNHSKRVFFFLMPTAPSDFSLPPNRVNAFSTVERKVTNQTSKRGHSKLNYDVDIIFYCRLLAPSLKHQPPKDQSFVKRQELTKEMQTRIDRIQERVAGRRPTPPTL
ncbi:unnamed protein product, partial [Strongylus vulgaris]